MNMQANLKKVVAFVVANKAALSCEDRAILTSEFAPTPETETETQIQNVVAFCESLPPPPKDTEDTEDTLLGVYHDLGVEPERRTFIHVTQGRKQGYVELRFDKRPDRSTLEYLKSAQVSRASGEGRKRAFRFSDKDGDKRWFGPSSAWSRLTKRIVLV